MILELTSKDGEFLVFGVHFSEEIVLSPTVGEQIFLNEVPLEPLKTSVRHGYTLWSAPAVFQTPLERILDVHANNQKVEFHENICQIEGWTHGLNGVVKLVLKMSESDPRWHGLPVVEDCKLLGIIQYQHYSQPPLVTPIDIVGQENIRALYMVPTIELEYRDELTSWYRSLFCNASFRHLDKQIELGKDCQVLVDSGETISVSGVELKVALSTYHFTPLIEWNSNVYIENETGKIVCIYRDGEFESEQLIPPQHAWLLTINGIVVTSFQSFCHIIENYQQSHCVIMWSNGCHETIAIDAKRSYFCAWKSAACLEKYEDPCFIE